MRHPPHSPDVWDSVAPTGTPGERAALVVACCVLLCVVVYLVMAPPLSTSVGDDVDHPAVIVPATAGPAVEYEEGR